MNFEAEKLPTPDLSNDGKKYSKIDVNNAADFKYNKPMFPRSHYTNDSIAEYEAQFDTRLIEEGIEILQSQYAFEIASHEETSEDSNFEVIYYYLYQISQLLDEGLKVENRSTLKKSFYKDLSPASAVEFLNCIKLLKKNFENFTNNLTSSQKYLNFKEKQSDMSTKFSAEKFDLRFNLIHADIDDAWKGLNKYQWSNMISLSSTTPSVTHFVSRLTCVRILYAIKKHFRWIGEFKNYADIGVGTPYLAACIKSFYFHVNVCGIDLQEVIDAIDNKLSVIKKEDSVLKEIVFRECNIVNILQDKYKRLLSYLRDCEVITNFIGLIETNEAFIKYVLPKSKCKMIMFRTKNIKFPTLHHKWLLKMGYKCLPEQLKGTLAFQSKEKFQIVIYTLAANEVKDISFGDHTLVGKVVKDDFIDIEDDDEYLKMSCSKQVRKRKFYDLQTLDKLSIDSPIIQEVISKLRKIFVNAGVSGPCICGIPSNKSTQAVDKVYSKKVCS